MTRCACTSRHPKLAGVRPSSLCARRLAHKLIIPVPWALREVRTELPRMGSPCNWGTPNPCSGGASETPPRLLRVVSRAWPGEYGLSVVAGERGPFNPLDRVNLARSVERALLAEPLSVLPPASSYPGAGLYALYYLGDFSAYAPIVPPAREPGEVPIYVGRAIPRGARAGVGGLLPTTTEPVLYLRLCQHASSLDNAENLQLEDFRCRYLVVDDIWVPLAEALMIQHYQPVWNQALQGFGNHDPGAGRRQGARPDWDEVHPGRPWAARQAHARRSMMETLTRIAAHFASVRALPASVRALPDEEVAPD